MTTVDTLLLEIANYGFEKLTPQISRRDFRILRNLSRLVKTSEFISENQGSLLIKILKENKNSLSFLAQPVDEILIEAKWSRQFRYVEQIRKIFTFSSDENEKFIGIEFTYTSSLKKIVQNMQSKVDGTLMFNVDKRFFLPLTEKNVVVVVETLKSQNFDISSEILEFYKTIKSWRPADFSKKFNFHDLTNARLLTQLSEEIGSLENSENLWLEDRKIRYQYEFHPSVKHVNLTYHIADRVQPKIWIDPHLHPLEDVIASLIELKRFPVMVVFSSFSEENSLSDLKKLTSALEKNDIKKGIGVYFRYNNNDTGKEFNQYIADNQLNTYLNEDAKIACVTSGKLPKFFINNKWQPKAVISFTNNLKNNKTSVYCNDCDLIVYYNDKQPLSDFITKTHAL